MIKTKSNLPLYISIVIATILWGFSFIWTNDLIGIGVPIFIFIFIRMLLSGVIMLAFSSITRTLQKVARKDMKWMFLLAFFGPFIYFIGESYGLKITGSATISAVIIATIPIFTMIMGRLLFKESLSRLNISGIITAVLGIVLFVWNSFSFPCGCGRGGLLFNMQTTYKYLQCCNHYHMAVSFRGDFVFHTFHYLGFAPMEPGISLI